MIAPLLRQTAPATRRLELGIYRDGDNNLDDIQAGVLNQAQDVSRRDHAIEFTIEDATSRENTLERFSHTERYTIADGKVSDKTTAPLANMSKRENLAHFVARTLDNAQRSGAAQTWVDLVNHGGGDGGGLEADSFNRGLMREDDIAGAIADGVAEHARNHPEDAARKVDGVVANQCLMATLGFESALSHAGVKFLAASPETMLAPGVPSSVAQAIADAPTPQRMAHDIVNATMHYRYSIAGESYGPAAAFDVLDLDPTKINAMQHDVGALNDALTTAAHRPGARAAIKEDAAAIEGMTRGMDPALPWHADRPALALYGTFAQDGRLGEDVREAARTAAGAIAATVMAHGESSAFAPFNASYDDAAGPTVHFPTTRGAIDPWKPKMSETDNAFYRDVAGGALANALTHAKHHAMLHAAAPSRNSRPDRP